MKPDFLMIAAGGGAFIAAIVAFCANRAFRRVAWTGALLWTMLGAGLLIRGFAPNLEIRDRAFRMTAVSATQPIRPKDIVDRERQMQLLAALLTLGAGLGLALYYRRTLTAGFNRASGPQMAGSPSQGG